MEDYKYGRKAFIKDVFLELPNYRYNHNPIEGDLEDDSAKKGKESNNEIFIGRKKIESQFLSILKFSGSNGSYLVTGYRGMGKTSFVKRVLKMYEKHCKIEKRNKNAVEQNVKIINISFAQSDLNEKDILKQITTRLIGFASKNLFVVFRGLLSFLNLFIFSFLSLLILSLVSGLFFPTTPKEESNESKIATTQSINADSNSVNLSINILLDKKEEQKQVQSKLPPTKSEVDTITESPKTAIQEMIQIFKDNWAKAQIKTKNFLNQIREDLKSKELDTKIAALIFVALVALLISSIFYFFRVILGMILLNIPNLKFTKYLIEKYVIEVELYKKLKDLEEKINASITKESGFQSSSERLPVGFSNKQTKAYNLLNSKEIETELIAILQEYSNLKYYTNDFIVVFDELDKVEPSLGRGFYNEKEDVRQNDKFANTKMDSTKIRREAIINILSSLKYFVTEARAKFIFIAGREMFDAALADIADRESFISSIFHQIIYVDSFLKESVFPNSGGNTVAVMAELYLSHILLPKEYNTQTNFLRDYYNYINTSYKELNYKNLSATEYQEELLKVIYTLQTFIVFLTYRSNGSPKKMVRMIEEYIIDDSNEKLTIDESRNIIIRRNTKSSKLYFSMTFKNQYHFGFITYLYRPFLMSQSVVLKDFSDNILVSTPYLMDHILKYHPFAFSRQNLELIPEVFTNNRNPLFRYFIDELVKYLNINHLRETELGIFDYKFLSKTTNELSYLSKIFEEELAALNFSLDEMFHVKHHLKEKILEIRHNYGLQKESLSDEFVRSISFLNSLLGDSYYFDQEYDNAIVAYSDGTQYLKLSDKPSLDLAISFINFRLKLGLVHERMGNFENALGMFGDCINELEKITNNGKGFYERRNQEIFKLYNLSYSAYLCMTEKYSYSGITEKIVEEYTEKLKEHFGKNITSVEKEIVLADYYNNVGVLLYYKNYSTEVFSLTRIENKMSEIVSEYNFYQKIKQQFGSEKDFILIDNKNIFKGRFGKGVPYSINDGKNYKQEYQSYNWLLNNRKYDDDKKSDEFDKFITKKFNRNPEISLKNKDEQFSFTALEYYRRSLYHSIVSIVGTKGKYQIKFNEKSSIKKLVSIAANLLYDRRTTIPKNTLRIIGYTLSCIGDSLISGTKDSDFKKIEHFINFIINNLPNNDNGKLSEYEKKKAWDKMVDGYFMNLYNDKVNDEAFLTFIIFIYYVSGRYFSKSGIHTSFGIQLKKILQVINRFSNHDNDSSKKQQKEDKKIIEFLKVLEDTILPLILEIASWNSDSTDRPQIYKYKNIISSIEGMPHPPGFARYNYSNISNHPDTREAILLFAKIKLRSNSYPKIEYNNLENITNNIPELALITPYQTISSQLSRMLELEVMSIINDKILKNYFPEIYHEWGEEPYSFFKRNFIDVEDIKNYPHIRFTSKEIEKERQFYDFLKYNIRSDEFTTKKKDFKNLVVNAIFSLLELIQIMDVYTINPYISNSFYASTHQKFGTWLKYYELSRLIDLIDGIEKEDKNETKNIIESMVGRGAMIIHDSTSHYQIALKHFHKAKEFHKNGKEYQNYLTNNLIFLEGSYDDELYHFGIAMERQSLNDESIRKRIRDLEKEVSKSPLLKYEYFANNKPLGD
ncbi:MAG: ATP-binding protein [Flavobacterium sp.]